MTTIPQRENKTLLDNIDEAMIKSAQWATELQAWISEPKGAYLPLFIEFYKSFSLLVRLTANLPELDKQQDLVLKCKEWVKPVKMGSKGEDVAVLFRISHGIELFDDYYHALNHSGLITIRK